MSDCILSVSNRAQGTLLAGYLPGPPMKLFLIIAAVLIIAASVFADYKWRQWMAARRRDHDRDHRS